MGIEPDESMAALIGKMAQQIDVLSKPTKRSWWEVAQTFMLPVAVALIGISISALDHFNSGDKKVDCPAYQESVFKLAERITDPTKLATTAAHWSGGSNAKSCGGTPTEILRGAGKVS